MIVFKKTKKKTKPNQNPKKKGKKTHHNAPGIATVIARTSKAELGPIFSM